MSEGPWRQNRIPRITAQKQIGLTRFDADRNGAAAHVEVPVAGQDVVFGDQSARAERTLFAFDADDAIAKHQGLVAADVHALDMCQ